MGVTYSAIYFLPFQERFGLTKHDIALRFAVVNGLFVYSVYIQERFCQNVFRLER